MSGYKAFHKDVIEKFDSIIKEYNFKPKIISKNSEIELISENCILSFLMYYDNITITIINPRSSQFEEYSMGALFNLFVPFQERNSGEAVTLYPQIKTFLEVHAELASKYLVFIFKGDFTWTSKYELFKEEEKMIYLTLGDSFIPSHYIYQKFIKRDESWKDDIKNIRLE